MMTKRQIANAAVEVAKDFRESGMPTMTEYLASKSANGLTIYDAYRLAKEIFKSYDETEIYEIEFNPNYEI